MGKFIKVNEEVINFNNVTDFHKSLYTGKELGITISYLSGINSYTQITYSSQEERDADFEKLCKILETVEC